MDYFPFLTIIRSFSLAHKLILRLPASPKDLSGLGAGIESKRSHAYAHILKPQLQGRAIRVRGVERVAQIWAPAVHQIKIPTSIFGGYFCKPMAKAVYTHYTGSIQALYRHSPAGLFLYSL